MTISLILVHEPDSVWKGSRRVIGNLNVPPDQKSLDKILALSEDFSKLSPKTVYSCSIDPAFSCAKALSAKIGLRHDVTDNLKPLDMGAWSGLDWMDVKDRFARNYRRWQANPYEFVPPLGESLCDVEKRLDGFMAEAKEKAEDCLIIASKEVLTAFCNNILPKYGASISSGDEKESEKTDLWQLFDFKTRWMSWDLLVDDED